MSDLQQPYPRAGSTTSNLLSRAKAGDMEAMGLLIERVLPEIVRAVGHGPHHDDAVQEAAIVVIEKLPMHEDRGLFRHWVSRVAKLTGKFVRRRADIAASGRGPAELSEIACSDPPSAGPRRQELQRAFLQCLGEIRHSWHEAVCLRLIEDLSDEDAAHRLGISVNALRIRISYGRSAIWKGLRERGLV